MIKLESISILACLIIGLVNGHGFMTEPPIRIKSWQVQNAEFSGGVNMQYYYRAGDLHVCGNSGFNGWNWPKNTQLTGNVTRTYTSGSTVTMNATFSFGHGGYFRVKLCKLNSPTDTVTGACFDQNVLKIVNFNYTSPLFTSQGGTPNASRYDDATIYVSYLQNTDPNLSGDSLTGYVSFDVKLPDGLICDNCVILWDFRQQFNGGCKFVDTVSSPSITTGVENYGESLCPSQSFRSCADVKIVQSSSAATATYVPNPVKPITTSYSKVFSCKAAGVEYGLTLDVKTNPNLKPDPLKYIGDGLFCLTYPDTSCTTCRINCMTSDKVCPSNCYCRWFLRKQNTYQTPINWADPTNY